MTCVDEKSIVSIIRCDEYKIEILEEKVAEAIELAGGLPENIKPGAKILLKPNLLTAEPPEAAATTHPDIVRALIRFLKKSGVNDITVGDSPAGAFTWEHLWDKTGFARMASDEDVPLLPFENIKRVEIPGVGSAAILKELDDFDAMISIPKLKTHMLTKVTGAVKNSYGLMPGGLKSNFHGKFPSPGKMSRFLVKFFELAKPDFVLMDAIVCMEGDGPSGGIPRHAGVMLAGRDAVAVDACACSVYGYGPRDIPMLMRAEEGGVGLADLEKIERVGDAVDFIHTIKALASGKANSINKFPEFIFKFLTYFLSCRPDIDQALCQKCGLCAKVCSQKAIYLRNDGVYKVKKSACILCMCCVESCPHHAIKMLSPGMKIKRLLKNILKRNQSI